MEKLKKIISIVTAGAIFASFALVGSNAATYNGTVKSTGTEISTTDTTATVKLTISAEVDMAAAGITVSTDFGALTNVSVPTENEVRYKIDPPADGGFNLANGTVIVEAKDQKDYPFNNAEVTLTFTKKDGLTLNDGDSFAVNVTPLKDSTIPAATYNEDEIYFAVDNINITVKPSTPTCEHANLAANKVVKFEDGVINYYTKCNDCDKLTLVSTDSSDVAAAHAATVANFATYSAIELTTAGTATIDLAGVEQTAIKLAYVSGDKIIANGAHTKTVAYNPITLTSYADGVVTIDSTVTGVIIAYTLTDSVAVDAVLGTAAMQRSFELLSNISYKFKLKQTSVQYSSADVFDSLYVVVDHDVYKDGSISTVKSEPIFANAELESGYYVFPYAVKAMQMGDTVVCNYYGVKDGVSYLLRVMDDYNVVTYAVKYSFVGTDEADKKLTSDLLRYGAEVQKYFGYNTSALVTDNQSVKAGLVEGSSVAITDLQKLTRAETNKVTIDGKEVSVVGWQRSVSVEDSIKINFKLAPANFVKYYGVSADELQLKMNYVDKFGNTQTKVLNFSDYNYTEDPRYVYVCDQIASSKMGTEASMEVWYQGEKISTFYYSVESFLNENYDSPTAGVATTFGAVCKAIANYSASAVAKFG